MPDLSCEYLIVIVNYRTADRVIDCLHSLKNETHENNGDYKICIIDNCSPDDSYIKLKNHISTLDWNHRIELILTEKNGGFSYGNNTAIKLALSSDKIPNYIHLLNPDTIARKDCLSNLRLFMDKHSQVGICGSRIQNPDNSYWDITFRFPTIFSEFEKSIKLGIISKALNDKKVAYKAPKENSQVDWLSGASLVIRTEVFKTIGLLDENYFLYYEETDFCLKALKNSWQTWYTPSSEVMHIAGESTQVNTHNAKEAELKRIPNYILESRRYYFLKNHGFFYTLLADITWICGTMLHRISRYLFLKKRRSPPYELRDFIKNSVIFYGNRIPKPKDSLSKG